MTTDLKQQIRRDRIESLKAGDKARKATLDYVLGEIQKKEKDPSAKGDIPTAIIQAYLKSLREFIDQHGAANPTQAAQYQAEIGFLEPYLPKQLTDNEIRAAIEAEQAGGNDKKGLIMKALKEKHGAALDGRKAAIILDEMGIK